ncbi:MAG: ParB N-terminal domain-containing protein [Bacteroidales bacterium]|jgi:ParB-like chromosome segregation protein Spo0J|nr:ParB N-terminal domain-containing protein [Bacteroidales bacterium]
MIDKQPISNVEWLDCRDLKANDYNPNVVLTQEMKLLEFSILRQGWVQPILVTQDLEIIDGFHRYWLSRTSSKIVEQFGYLVPVVKLDLPIVDRMLLTIRINRAKGNHIAFKMHEIVYKLIHDYNISPKKIAEEIGASKQEIDLLAKKDVFEVLDIQNHEYSKGWKPKKKND